jgi:hypothetical protein
MQALVSTTNNECGTVCGYCFPYLPSVALACVIHRVPISPSVALLLLPVFRVVVSDGFMLPVFSECLRLGGFVFS